MLLKILGVVDLLAIVAVLMPAKTMSWVHALCGMGTLPDDPIVGYLARSTSALYAMHGVLILFISIDIARYRPLVRFLGIAAIIHGGILLGIDCSLKMPWFWTATEGPIFASAGVMILACSRGSGHDLERD